LLGILLEVRCIVDASRPDGSGDVITHAARANDHNTIYGAAITPVVLFGSHEVTDRINEFVEHRERVRPIIEKLAIPDDREWESLEIEGTEIRNRIIDACRADLGMRPRFRWWQFRKRRKAGDEVAEIVRRDVARRHDSSSHGSAEDG
jgi:hypothetical protein